MKQIRILSESAALGNRLRGILYDAGYAVTAVSDLNAMPVLRQTDLTIIYARSHIAEIMRAAADCGANVILLLNPDCYALYLDRARHAGVRLLLNPVTPDMLLESVTAFS